MKRLLTAKLWLALLLGAALLSSAARAEEGKITVTPLEGKVRVEIGGKLFTEYVYTNTTKPFLYPVIGPGEVAVTRNYPMVQDAPGEDKDHPHHRSLWFCHGAVNGVDFWGEVKKNGKITYGTIEQDKLELATVVDGKGVIKATDRWVGPEKKTYLTDSRTMTLQALPGGMRAIDFEITLKASEGDVTFGDTKEGSMAIRTVSNLALKSKTATSLAKAVNSEGEEGQKIWGKHARWVNYWGTVGGRQVGVAIFDNPANPRFPTTWHAREYGLIAVNPFGLSDFEKKPKGTGDLKLKKGETVTFRYRFLFHEGISDQAKVEEAWKQYAGK